MHKFSISNLRVIRNKSNIMKKSYLILQFFLVVLLFGCGVSEDQKNLANKAMEKIEACKSLGEAYFEVKGKCLVWSISANSLDPIQDRLPWEIRYRSGFGDVTVFLVSETECEIVGKYSVSGQPAYRRWADVYVVQAPEMKPIGCYRSHGLDPSNSRSVQNSPEFGELPIAKWIENRCKPLKKSFKERN